MFKNCIQYPAVVAAASAAAAAAIATAIIITGTKKTIAFACQLKSACSRFQLVIKRKCPCPN